MFTVNFDEKLLNKGLELFQNISCLRLILKADKLLETNLNFKTFHVYG